MFSKSGAYIDGTSEHEYLRKWMKSGKAVGPDDKSVEVKKCPGHMAVKDL